MSAIRVVATTTAEDPALHNTVIPLDINNNGQVVGEVQFMCGTYSYACLHAPDRSSGFVWQGGVQQLISGREHPALAYSSNPFARAMRIDDSGLVLVYAWKYPGTSDYTEQFTFFWRDGQAVALPNGSVAEPALEIHNDCNITIPFDMNGAGGLLGMYYYDYGEPLGSRQNYLYCQDGVKGVAVDGRVTASFQDFIPLDLNERGQVLGKTQSGLPAVWENGRLMFLELYEGAAYPVARAMNDLGQVVGQVGGRPVLWDEGSVFSLADAVPKGSGCTLEEVSDINNLGWIVGTAQCAAGTRAVLLIPKE